jgi:hypothetical protein
MEKNIISNKISINDVIFFLGAGASVKAGLKTMVQLTDYFQDYWLKVRDPNPYHLKFVEELIKKIQDFRNYKVKNQLSNKETDNKVDIETLLETIERLEEYDDDIISAFVKNNNLIWKNKQIEILRKKELSKEIKKFIKTTFIDDMKSVDYLKPLINFNNIKPLNVFSTNYDLTIENLCSLYNFSYTDGFNQKWDKELFFNSKEHKDLNIFKLHGSVNWYGTKVGEYFSIPIKTKDMDIRSVSGYIGTPLILYPGNKFKYVEPILDILVILKDMLLKAKCCFIIGYSFRDDHIRKLFHYTARNNKQLIIFIVSPDAHNIYNEKLTYYLNEQTIDKEISPIPSDLEDRVILLPYKFEKILPNLRQYYENLEKGLRYDSLIYDSKEIGEPLNINQNPRHKNEIHIIDENSPISYEELLNITDIKKSLDYYSKCEYFKRCEEIIKDSEGWDKVLRDDLRFSLSLLLRFVLNYLGSNNQRYYSLFRNIIELKREKLIPETNSDSIYMYYKINESGNPLNSSDAQELFKELKQIIHQFVKKSNQNIFELEGLINSWLRILIKWQNNSIGLKWYKDNYIKTENQEHFSKLINKVNVNDINNFIIDNELYNS